MEKEDLPRTLTQSNLQPEPDSAELDLEPRFDPLVHQLPLPVRKTSKSVLRKRLRTRKAHIGTIKKFSDEEVFIIEIGHAISRARGNQRMSQEELAKIIGTKQAAISRIEMGDANLTLKMLFKIVTALKKKVSVDLREIEIDKTSI